MTRVKVCGIRTPDDVAAVNACRPDYIGYVFAPSERQISLETAKQLTKISKREIKKVGVFVNQPVAFLTECLASGAVDFLQLHGDEDRDYERALFDALRGAGETQPEQRCIRARRIRTAEDIAKADDTACAYLLLDAYSPTAYGGAGERFDWRLIQNLRKPFFLAGGLTAENVADAVAQVHPFAVDASSSMETDGKKDAEKIRAFVAAARKSS